MDEIIANLAGRFFIGYGEKRSMKMVIKRGTERAAQAANTRRTLSSLREFST